MLIHFLGYLLVAIDGFVIITTLIKTLMWVGTPVFWRRAAIWLGFLLLFALGGLIVFAAIIEGSVPDSGQDSAQGVIFFGLLVQLIVGIPWLVKASVWEALPEDKDKIVGWYRHGFGPWMVLSGVLPSTDNGLFDNVIVYPRLVVKHYSLFRWPNSYGIGGKAVFSPVQGCTPRQFEKLCRRIDIEISGFIMETLDKHSPGSDADSVLELQMLLEDGWQKIANVDVSLGFQVKQAKVKEYPRFRITAV